MGDVVKAGKGTCECYMINLNDKKIDLCWKEGVRGTLTNTQELQLCETKVYKDTDDVLIDEVIKAFHDSANLCKEKKGDYRACMKVTLPKIYEKYKEDQFRRWVEEGRFDKILEHKSSADKIMEKLIEQDNWEEIVELGRRLQYKGKRDEMRKYIRKLSKTVFGGK